jgi:hypothetical protein
MTGRKSIGGNLTKPGTGSAVLLTLTLVFVLNTHVSMADPLPATASVEERARVSQASSYLRKQTLLGMSVLPGSLRSTLNWFSGNWHPVSLSGGSDEEIPSEQALAEPEESGISIPMQLGANYHHKGFLPTHDAMIMGVGFDQKMLDDKLQFTARPFYGQSWHSLRHYLGGEIALDIAQHPDGLPWGKIAVGYIKGDSSLTDHGTGIDLHGDIDLTNNWKFTSGVRQDSVTGDSNYVMLRWKLSFD